MIVVDIGNTNTVFGFYLNNKLIKIVRIKTEKKKIENDKSIKHFFKSNKNFLKKIEKKNCIVSSVVPSINLTLKKYFIKNKFRFYIIDPRKIPFEGKINYNLNQIGSDRVANYAYVYNQKIKNCIIIDFGTATTFDVIKNNHYSGGIIFPGINLSMYTLIENAELIKTSKISKLYKIVKRNTSDSIQSGFYFGYLHAINGILKQIIKEYNFKPKIIITGGLGKIYKDNILFKPIYNENLTLEGIKEIGKKVFI